MACNFDIKQQVATPRQEMCRRRGININGQNIRENGEGVARGVIQENERRDDKVEEVDGIRLSSCKRKHRESVSP